MNTMLILRGIADASHPKGLLDDASALEYAKLRGFDGEVLDVRGNGTGPQVEMALGRIAKGDVVAIYGFSGGGYNARRIWTHLDQYLRARIRLVVIVGSPRVTRAEFFGCDDVVIFGDPPQGHMAGPRILLSTIKETSMANYRSLVGGYFSSTPYDKSIPASIRTNNPGAINGASWIAAMPGFVTTSNLDGKNHASIFETPEQGVAVWLELMRKYRANSATTVEQIITRYGGGQDYSGYVADIVKRTGLARTQEIKLQGDDATLIKFARSMFRHEAGQESPLSDAQILHGFRLARGDVTPARAAPTEPKPSLWSILLSLISGAKPAAPAAPAAPPKPPIAGSAEPAWLLEAKKDLGFREVGNNRGIDKFIDEAGVGALGDPWCAIFVNAKLEECGVPGSRSAMARSFETHKNFVRLSGPALGAIATFWRGSRASGSGHVNFYAGTDAQGRHVGVGGNQGDVVSAAYMDMSRHTGWWWPKDQPLPAIGAVRVTGLAAVKAGSEV